MSSYELYLPPERKKYNPKTGRFVKGLAPFNKGRKWSEWMSKRGQRRAAKGWVNLDKYRPKTRPDTAGRCRRKIVAVTDEGKFYVFGHSAEVGEWLGCNRRNATRCCQWNSRHGKNTDYRVRGVRLYYESDNIWTTKIKR